MRIQNIIANLINEKMALEWTILCDTKAIAINIATDSEFTEANRIFILPPVTACSLDTGTGSWYIRIGVFIGDDKNGTIEWSGIVGPIIIISKKGVVPVPKSKLKVFDSQPVQKGVRINTRERMPYYAIIEYSKDGAFLSSGTSTQYTYDWGRGYVECTGLSYEYTYHIRVSGFCETPDKLVTDTVRQCSVVSVLSDKKAAKPLVFTSTMDRAINTANELLVREVRERKNHRFTSYFDYNRFIAASTRFKESKG
jgi:hypothetical protein